MKKVVFDAEHIYSPVGMMMRLGWDNPKTERMIRSLFGLRTNEEILALIITKDGLSVEIGTESDFNHKNLSRSIEGF